MFKNHENQIIQEANQVIVSFFRFFFSFPFIIESTSNKTVQLLQEMKLQRKKKKLSKKPIKRSIKMPADVYRSWHSYLQSWNPPPPLPLSGYPPLSEANSKNYPPLSKLVHANCMKYFKMNKLHFVIY